MTPETLVEFFSNMMTPYSKKLLLFNLIVNWIAYILVGLFTINVFCNLRIKLEFWSWIRYLLLAIAATIHTISVTTEYSNEDY